MTDGSRTRMTISEAFAAVPILPVLTFDDPLDALVVCSALREGGIRAVEITLRTASGAAAIERVAAETDLLVGAGTVLTGADVHRVIGAGARFLVSPGFDDEVVQTARDAGIPAVPGVATPTEVQRALRAGLTDVKVFPASSLGGAGLPPSPHRTVPPGAPAAQRWGHLRQPRRVSRHSRCSRRLRQLDGAPERGRSARRREDSRPGCRGGGTRAPVAVTLSRVGAAFRQHI